MIYLYTKPPCFHECRVYDGPSVALSMSRDDALELLEQIQALSPLCLTQKQTDTQSQQSVSHPLTTHARLPTCCGSSRRY